MGNKSSTTNTTSTSINNFFKSKNINSVSVQNLTELTNSALNSVMSQTSTSVNDYINASNYLIINGPNAQCNPPPAEDIINGITQSNIVNNNDAITAQTNVVNNITNQFNTQVSNAFSGTTNQQSTQALSSLLSTITGQIGDEIDTMVKNAAASINAATNLMGWGNSESTNNTNNFNSNLSMITDNENRTALMNRIITNNCAATCIVNNLVTNITAEIRASNTSSLNTMCAGVVIITNVSQSNIINSAMKVAVNTNMTNTIVNSFLQNVQDIANTIDAQTNGQASGDIAAAAMILASIKPMTLIAILVVFAIILACFIFVPILIKQLHKTPAPVPVPIPPTVPVLTNSPASSSLQLTNTDITPPMTPPDVQANDQDNIPLDVQAGTQPEVQADVQAATQPEVQAGTQLDDMKGGSSKLRHRGNKMKYYHSIY